MRMQAIFIICFLIGIGCESPKKNKVMEKQENAITITIGVYSGRRNPEMPLGDNKSRELLNMLKKAKGGESIHQPPPAKLGQFYGYYIQLPQNVSKEYGLSSEYNVYYGVVTEISGREEHHWRDTNKVEQYLTELAFEQGYGELLEKFGVKKPSKRN
ncbi:MAG: hypothetical protein EPGJADBJ_01872 [Saprospiraceae bacterium]|nr:hypothetical protein [Saprospiraceae bacterium]